MIVTQIHVWGCNQVYEKARSLRSAGDLAGLSREWFCVFKG